jgi:hypothetical protein
LHSRGLKLIKIIPGLGFFTLFAMWILSGFIRIGPN